jgi:hypothetical protein
MLSPSLARGILVKLPHASTIKRFLFELPLNRGFQFQIRSSTSVVPIQNETSSKQQLFS